jgi:hypothetical protein
MTRAEWQAKYREWRVQDRVWRELQRAGKWQVGDAVPAFCTWVWPTFSSTRLFFDFLHEFPLHRKWTHTMRLHHLRERVRLP